jgi:5-(carboxyamino)imidazole ribonucleotide synthase
MLALAARPMGYRVHVLSPKADSPTGQVADREVVADYADADAVAEFARHVDVVTFEFENIPAAATEAAEKFAPVRPGGHVLHTTQHRLREKSTLAKHGLPVTPFAAVRSLDDLKAGLAKLGCPAVLKTAAWGYDGKGQTVIRSPQDAESAWYLLNADEAILEAFIDFQCEVSVIAARGVDGTIRLYGPMLNHHENHILALSVAPAVLLQDGVLLSEAVPREARMIARTVMETLDVVGVLCVEFFVTQDDRLLINELAPRPHNSGHLTIEAHETSQFEQQARAVCGLPLGSDELLRPAAMANLLGDLWQPAEPDWAAVLHDPHVKLHLYGKKSARPGRKMGHVTALADTPEEAADKASGVVAFLRDRREILRPR